METDSLVQAELRQVELFALGSSGEIRIATQVGCPRRDAPTDLWCHSRIALIASKVRTVPTAALTSCTRTMSAPRNTAALTAAIVPCNLSVTGAPSSTRPINDFLDVPIRMGNSLKAFAI